MPVAAAEDVSLTEPLLGLAGVLVTAIIGFITTWRWPTLRRRVQEHAAIVKELPDGASSALGQLLEKESTKLAKQDEWKLDPVDNAFTYIIRAQWTVAVGAWIALPVFALAVPDFEDRGIPAQFL